MRCGTRALPHRMVLPIPGSQLRVCAPGYGCKAGAGPAIDLDDAVRSVLRAAEKPLGPTAIHARIWAQYAIDAKREALERSLYRVGGRVGRGRYVAREVTP